MNPVKKKVAKQIPFGYVKWVADRSGRKISVRSLIAYAVHSIKLFNGTSGATVVEVAKWLGDAGYTYKKQTIQRVISSEADLFPRIRSISASNRENKKRVGVTWGYEYSINLRDYDRIW